MKKILLVIVFLLVLLAIPITLFLVKQNQDLRQRAAPATTIFMDPASANPAVNDIFTINVRLDTGGASGNAVTGVEINLAIDPPDATQYVQIQSIEAGTFFGPSAILVAGSVGNNEGSASITVGSTTGKQNTQSDDLLAVVTLKAIANTSSPIQLKFQPTTKAGALGEGSTNVITNLLVGQQNASITVGSGSTASPSPSPSPSTSPSSTPGGPTPTPLPTPTTTISSPQSGATVTTNRPTFSGKSFNNGLVILSINTSPITTSNIDANASGNWSYTPTSDIPNGNYAMTITATQSGGSGTPEVIASNFNVAAAGGNGGGGGGANPSPSPSASPQTSNSPQPSASGVPVTGSTAPTFFLLGVGLILALFGSGAIFFR